MSLPRKSSVNQLKRLRKEIGKDIGDKTNVKAERNLPNSLWIDNPADREIDTVNNHIKLEVESFKEFEAALANKKSVEQLDKVAKKSGNKKGIGKVDTINKNMKLEVESFEEFKLDEEFKKAFGLIPEDIDEQFAKAFGPIPEDIDEQFAKAFGEINKLNEENISNASIQNALLYLKSDNIFFKEKIIKIEDRLDNISKRLNNVITKNRLSE